MIQFPVYEAGKAWLIQGAPPHVSESTLPAHTLHPPCHQQYRHHSYAYLVADVRCVSAPTTKTASGERGEDRDLSTAELIGVSSVAKLAASIVSYPHEV